MAAYMLLGMRYCSKNFRAYTKFSEKLTFPEFDTHMHVYISGSKKF